MNRYSSFLLVLFLAFPITSRADIYTSGLYDFQYNALTTNQTTGTRNPLDIEAMFSGSIIDPRSIRALTSADVISCVQSTPNVVASAWPVKITDGTSTQAVKAASTAPVATDPASVVALSPNGNQATAANQSSQITQETTTATNTGALSTNFGTQSDTAATSDTGTFSYVSLFKRALASYLSSIQNTSNSTASNTSSIVTTTTSIQSTSNSTATNTSAIQTNQTNGTQRTLVADLVGNLQPAGASAATTIFVRLNDGTNSTKVLAGSAQASISDTALEITSRPDNVGTPTQTSVSCAATSTTLLAASTASMFLSVRNPTTSTVTIWLNTAGAAAVAAAPSLDLPPGSEAYFSAEGSSFLPTSQINCISGGSASSVTITYK